MIYIMDKRKENNRAAQHKGGATMKFKDIVKLLCSRYKLNACEGTKLASGLKEELELSYSQSLEVFSSAESLSSHLDKIETL